MDVSTNNCGLTLISWGIISFKLFVSGETIVLVNIKTFLSSPGLAYCRHLSTVRTHLSALVNTTIVDPDVPGDARGGLSVEVWGRFLKDSSVRLAQKHQAIRCILVLIHYSIKWFFYVVCGFSMH